MKSFKETCIDLRQKDYTLNEIVKITGRSKTTIYFHIKDISLSAEKRTIISQATRERALVNSLKRKGKSLREFLAFTKWKPENVLLVSHLIFDGEISKKCAYNNRSVALVKRFVLLMEGVYKFPPKRYINSTTGVIKVSYNNVAMANFFKLKSVELISCVHKLPASHQREFIRAFFDDEGCMDLEW